MATALQDCVIRLEREGVPPRWVRSIARTDDMGRTITWDIADARRMTDALAQRHAARLQQLLKRGGWTISAERLQEETTPCAA